MAAKLFISYCHKDEEICNELLAHLASLRRQGIISEWYDRKIVAGTEWGKEIHDKLRVADVVILLISADFIASDYCYDIEMSLALERHAAGTLTVIPVLARPVAGWEALPFAKIQAVPHDGKAVSEWADRDQAFRQIVEALSHAVQRQTNIDQQPYEAAAGPTIINHQDPSRIQRTVTEEGAGPSCTTPDNGGVVLLVHGIRDHGEWQGMVESVMASETVIVKPIKYGYFDVFRFIAPLWPKRKPRDRITREYRNCREMYPGRNVSVIAHSFGGYLVTSMLLENSDIHLWRLVLCGSVVRQDFRWDKIKGQLGNPNDSETSKYVVNECGSRDIWPVLAKAAGWGYGAAGTDGFGTARVTDRFHAGGHGLYFDPQFVETYWKPFILRGELLSGVARQRFGLPMLVRAIGHLPLKLLPLVAILLPLLLILLKSSPARPTDIPRDSVAELKRLGFTARVIPSSDGAGRFAVIGARSLGLTTLDELGEILHPIRLGIMLTLDDFDSVESFSGLRGARLVELVAPSCDHLEQLWSPGAFPELKRLSLDHCDSLSNLAGCSNLPCLEELDASRCPLLTVLADLKNLPRLRRLVLNNCQNLASIEPGGQLDALTEVELKACTKLSLLSGVERMPNLQTLDLTGCTSLSSLRPLAKLQRLEKLTIRGDHVLSDIKVIANLPRLRTVYVGKDATFNDRVKHVAGTKIAVVE